MAQTIVDRRELGLRLHMLRFACGWSLRDVEERTGIPQTTLSRWERARDKTYPDLDRLAQLAELYGLTVARLLDPEPLEMEPVGYASDRGTPEQRGRYNTDGLIPAAA